MEPSFPVTMSAAPSPVKSSAIRTLGLFAVEVLVCVHCAGKLRLVEIATEPAAIKRIIRNERRRQGEPVSEMEARAPPRGPPCQLMFAFR